MIDPKESTPPTDPEQLRRVCRRYEALAEAQGNIVWVVDPSLHTVGQSEGWERYTGQPPEAYAERGWIAAVHPEDRDRLQAESARALAVEEPLVIEFRIRRADGAYRRNLIRALPIREGDRLVEWIGTASDVEDARQTADEQRDLRARLLALTNGADALLAARTLDVTYAAAIELARNVLSGDGYGLWVWAAASREWRMVSGYGVSERFASERVGGDLVTFAQPIGVPDVNDSAMVAARREAYASEGIRSLLAIPLPIGGERRATLVIYYRTAHVTTETELRVGIALGHLVAAAIWNAETYEALNRANTSKDEFLALLSHELRTPLNAIMGWTHMLRGGLPPDMTAHAIEVISRNARSQKQLVEDLLDVARIAGGRLDLHRSHVDLCDIARVGVDSALPVATAKGITLSCETAPGQLLVNADADRLQQLIANLLSNGVKFTENGGRITVRARRTAEGAELTVQDSGVGIAAEFLPDIFDRFRQGDTSLTRAYGGLGLGLWVVKQIADAHGATVRAASPGAGGGATLTVTWPSAMLMS